MGHTVFSEVFLDGNALRSCRWPATLSAGCLLALLPHLSSLQEVAEFSTPNPHRLVLLQQVSSLGFSWPQ